MADGFHINQFNPPDTQVRTSHSVTIYAGGQRIGLLNGWNPQMSRDITPIYEIAADTSGVPLENVPGNTKGLTIGVNRYDLWTSQMETVFGTADLTMLSNQSAPFTCLETWKLPSGQIETYEYSGCWFSSIGRNIRSDDQRIVNVNASLTYVHKRKI